MVAYLVDTCIWLNLLRKEGDSRKGVPYWRIAQMFLKKAAEQEAKIFCSRVILRELQINLSADEFIKARSVLSDCDEIELSKEDVKTARKMESDLRFEISFYDLLHIILAKKAGAVLITRDRQMMEVAREYGVECSLPEKLCTKMS
jgi:predicted nucleic acid-binding protein